MHESRIPIILSEIQIVRVRSMLTSDIQTCTGVGVGGVLYYAVHIRGEGG